MKRFIYHTALITTLLAPLPSFAASLQEALETTYKTNPELAAERSNLASVDEQASQAFSGWLPSATFGYDKGHEKVEVGARPEESDSTTSTTWRIQQPIFNGGRTVALTHRATQQIKASRAALQQTEQRVLLNAVTAYMNVIRDHDVLELSRNNVSVLEKHLEITKERFRLGEVTRTDVAQAEARLASAISDRTQAEGQFSTSQANYKRVVGVAPSNPIAPTALPVLPTNLDEVIARAKANNPAVKRAKYSLEVAHYEVNANAAELLPDVALVGTKRSDDGFAAYGGQDYDSETIALNVSVPLYQSGIEYSRIRQAKETKQQRKFLLDDADNSATEDAISAWENYQVAKATIVSTQSSAEAAQVALDGVTQEADVGSRTTLDVLDAEQELFVAKSSLIRAKRNEIVSMYNLQSVMGVLTAGDLKLNVPVYDPEKHYDNVKYKVIGLGTSQ